MSTDGISDMQDATHLDDHSIPTLDRVVTPPDLIAVPPPPVSPAIPATATTLSPDLLAALRETLTQRVMENVQHTVDGLLPDLLRQVENELKDSLRAHLGAVLPEMIQDILDELQSGQ